MFLFDTNIFLEILLERKYATQCERVFSSVSAERVGWLTGYTIHSIEAIIGALQDRAGSQRHWHQLLEKFLTSIAIHPYLRRYDTSTLEERIIVRLAHETGLDFDDALQYYAAKSQQLTLVTLDRDFRKITDIPIVNPAEV